MKKILIQGVVLAALIVFLFKGGMRLLLLGWRLFVPLVLITLAYFAVRHVLQKKKVGSKAGADSLSPGQPIVICPHCNKPKGSCPRCSDQVRR